VFSNWKESANSIIIKMENSMNKNIVNRIEKFLSEPLNINESNHYLIQDQIVDLYNKEKREMYFAKTIKISSSEIYSFSYGTEKGEYYGARRNEKSEIEIMENNSSTGGKTRYYSTTENLTSDRLLEETGEFDPRTRDWYKSAKETKKPIFSPIYKHFIMNDLALSASYPIYNKDGNLEGVVGTHIILSNINRYLKEIVSERNATAYIVEKNSGNVVANSFENPNFITLTDGSVHRVRIDEIEYKQIVTAYKEYIENSKDKLILKYQKDKLHLKVIDFQKEGLSWLIITCIPEGQFTGEINKSINLSLILSIIAICIAILVFLKITNIILKPIYNLIRNTEKFSQGDFSQRASVYKNDEIGKLSIAFNKMAEQLYTFFNTLEEKVALRTSELEKTNSALKKSEGNIRLLLDSTAEAIYGIDLNGNCTFCNNSCLEMLRYKDHSDLIGKNMHSKILNNNIDGTSAKASECSILKRIIKGEGIHAEDEVFWRSDGTCFPVEYFTHPQYRDGKIIGAVVTFMDISERKKSHEEILFLSYHDQLTGLYNRRYFEDELNKLDNPSNYPLTIVMADMNGLKLVNDSLGHAIGDELLKKVADVLKRGWGRNSTIARLGGDEFVVLLPRTGLKETEQIIRHINKIAIQEKVENVDISISFGYETKTTKSESIQDVFKKAEDNMYKKKLLESPSMRSKTVSALISTFNEKNEREKAHSQRVSELCKSLGEALDLTSREIEELKSVGLLHDIGKIALEESVLNNPGKLSKEEWHQIRRHPEIGYRILSTVNDLAEMAEYVLTHHERWDGNGYPKGLKGTDIPLQSRIIAIADAYDAMISERSYRSPMSEEAAIKELEKGMGTQFDPTITKVFIKKVLGS
jgi:diguanylate cyclase (GGDEF)-like protein/PAS domain S-box-containing protein